MTPVTVSNLKTDWKQRTTWPLLQEQGQEEVVLAKEAAVALKNQSGLSDNELDTVLSKYFHNPKVLFFRENQCLLEVPNPEYHSISLRKKMAEYLHFDLVLVEPKDCSDWIEIGPNTKLIRRSSSGLKQLQPLPSTQKMMIPKSTVGNYKIIIS